MKGDEEGNWTYTGERGESVIDYVLVEEMAGGSVEYGSERVRGVGSPAAGETKEGEGGGRGGEGRRRVERCVGGDGVRREKRGSQES